LASQQIKIVRQAFNVIFAVSVYRFQVATVHAHLLLCLHFDKSHCKEIGNQQQRYHSRGYTAETPPLSGGITTDNVSIPTITAVI